MHISSLRTHPHFADTIADRGWHAWWRDSGKTLADYRSGLEPMFASDKVPQAHVAHEAETYLGSVLLMGNDLDERSQYTPWVAALWVEPVHRAQGIAAALLKHARLEARYCGHDTAYLCASPEIARYYLARGWRLIETNVSGLSVLAIGTRPDIQETPL